MGSSSSKEDIMTKLEELDRKELDLNLKLKDMQIELNGMVPKNEQIKVNEDLTPNSKIEYGYSASSPKNKSPKRKKSSSKKVTKSKKEKSGKKKKK